MNSDNHGGDDQQQTMVMTNNNDDEQQQQQRRRLTTKTTTNDNNNETKLVQESCARIETYRDHFFLLLTIQVENCKALFRSSAVDIGKTSPASEMELFFPNAQQFAFVQQTVFVQNVTHNI